jgi:hypothetical protein
LTGTSSYSGNKNKFKCSLICNSNEPITYKLYLIYFLLFLLKILVLLLSNNSIRSLLVEAAWTAAKSVLRPW